MRYRRKHPEGPTDTLLGLSTSYDRLVWSRWLSEDGCRFKSERVVDLHEITGANHEEFEHAGEEFEPANAIALVFEKRVLALLLASHEDKVELLKAVQWLMGVADGEPFNVQHLTHVDSEMLWSGKDALSMFMKKEKIGEGSFGEVHKAMHKPSGNLMATMFVRFVSSSLLML